MDVLGDGVERGRVAGVESLRAPAPARLRHSGSTTLSLTSARPAQLAASDASHDAASNSARRPLRGSHPFGKRGNPSLRANRRTGTGAPLIWGGYTPATEKGIEKKIRCARSVKAASWRGRGWAGEKVARSAPPVTTSSTKALRLRFESRPARANCDAGHTGDRKRNGEEHSLSSCATPRIIVSSHQ
jgi:hypothetical protein